MRINFDMDGTIANLYGVENWLDKLMVRDDSPYRDAKALINLSLLARYLNKLQRMGFEIGVISWLAKNSTPEYNYKVIDAKIDWLAEHLPSVMWDAIEIVPYGTPKETFCFTENDILFDDEIANRENWTGRAYAEIEIFEVLKALM